MGGLAGRCDTQTELWFLGQMTDRSGGGDRANEETSTAVQRAENTRHSPPEGHSFIQQMLREDLASQALRGSVRIKLLTPYLRCRTREDSGSSKCGLYGVRCI